MYAMVANHHVLSSGPTRPKWPRSKTEPTAEQFYKWRKRVKYHWSHSRLLEYVWGEVMGGTTKGRQTR